MSTPKQHWQWQIGSGSGWWDINLREILAYRDLIFQLVRKNLLSSYQQTLLGPFWVLFQPLVTVITYVIVFDRIIGVSTEGVPAFIFYMAGVTLWNLFTEVFTSTSDTITGYADIFNKVYFPRLAAPISMLFITLVHFSIQFLIFLAILVYLYLNGSLHFDLSKFFLFIPVVVLIVLAGLGLGLIFSVITTKYRDMKSLLHVIIRVLMFATPVFFTLSIVPAKMVTWVNLNPLAPLFELYRLAFFNKGLVSLGSLSYSCAFIIFFFVLGIAAFSKYHQKLLDVV